MKTASGLDIFVMHFLRKLNNNFFDIRRDSSGRFPLGSPICIGRNYKEEEKVTRDIKNFLFFL